MVDRDTTLAVVDWVLDNPDVGPEEVHVWWEERKMEAGVSTGPVRTEGSHPSMIEYEELPASEKAKDRLVVGVVRAMEVML